MIIKRDEAFKVLCEFLTPVGLESYNVGTGMLVSIPVDSNKMIATIVTASHIAMHTNESTQIVISNNNGMAERIPLTMFGPLSGWKHHPIADISVFQIVLNDKNFEYMQGRFFPLEQFNLNQEVVSRDYELTAIGFPNGLGTEGLFSPFSFRTFASSGFVTLQRADTLTPCTFFCLENSSLGGYSGCPVFDLGYSTDGTMITTRGDTVCHGIMHGVMSDQNGAKIAMVTPAFYLRDFI